jgi:zinc protease
MSNADCRPLRRPAWCLVLATLLLIGLASGAHAGIADAVKTETLPNGLKVLVLENHKAPVATLSIMYRVGSRNEQFGKTGISHLCEHLMFRGTNKLKPEEFSNIIQENGGMDNAFTGADYTDYFEIMNHKHLDVAIKLEANRMAHFEPKGFKTELAVVEEERRMRDNDNPEAALSDLAQAQAYVEFSYHWPVIGWMQDIKRLTLQYALKYHSMYYSPRNAVVAAVGDFNADQVLKQIKEAFGQIKNGPKPPPVSEVEAPQKGERRVVLRHAANLPAFAEAFHVPNYLTNRKDAFALEVLSEVLSDGKSSRLYKTMVINKPTVVDVSVSYDMTTFNPGLFWVSAEMRPGIKTTEAIAQANGVIKELKAKPVGADELQKAKNLEHAEFVYGEDSIFNEALELQVWQMLGNYHLVDQYLSNIDKVTAADVQRVAKKYLVKSNCTLGVLVPTGVLPHQQGGGGTPSGPIHYAPRLPTSAEIMATAPPMAMAQVSKMMTGPGPTTHASLTMDTEDVAR